ncbi:hypothetical protein L618_000500001170 [Rhodococcus rhodochrous J45]|uniref:Uncharacterized protein n=1 Tax=Rhodococcus rhodochrous J45 TaxID=935266 RepID=A0A562DJQ2_RHORH|nr:hypothetical protein L618_000500001170 [Rhodococcus rhodochrous J45]
MWWRWVRCRGFSAMFPSCGRFDAVGAVGPSAALVCLLPAISKGVDRGWSSTLTIGFLAAVVLLLVVWGRCSP